jgi:hypothetical protein
MLLAILFSPKLALCVSRQKHPTAAFERGVRAGGCGKHREKWEDEKYLGSTHDGFLHENSTTPLGRAAGHA